MRAAVLLVVVGACGDSPPPAAVVADGPADLCATPRFSSVLNPWLDRPCHGYTQSAAGVGMMACDDTKQIEMIAVDGTISPAVGLPFARAHLSADGRSVTLVKPTPSAEDEIHIYVEESGVWTYASTLIAGVDLTTSGISLDRRVVVYKQPTYTLVELVETNGAWTEVHAYPMDAFLTPLTSPNYPCRAIVVAS